VQDSGEATLAAAAPLVESLVLSIPRNRGGSNDSISGFVALGHCVPARIAGGGGPARALGCLELRGEAIASSIPYARFTQLQSLEVQFSRYFDDAAVQALPPTLALLLAMGCSSVTAASLPRLARIPTANLLGCCLLPRNDVPSALALLTAHARSAALCNYAGWVLRNEAGALPEGDDYRQSPGGGAGVVAAGAVPLLEAALAEHGEAACPKVREALALLACYSATGLLGGPLASCFPNLPLTIRFLTGGVLDLAVPWWTTIASIKEVIWAERRVQPYEQRLIGLVPGLGPVGLKGHFSLSDYNFPAGITVHHVLRNLRRGYDDF
jgi:hypothetical protein